MKYTDVIVLNAPPARDLAQFVYISMGINAVVNGDIDLSVKALEVGYIIIPIRIPIHPRCATSDAGYQCFCSRLRMNVLACRELYEIRQRRKGL